MTDSTLKSYTLLQTPPHLKKVAFGLFIFFACFIIFVLITPWQQTSYGYGQVVAYSATERQQTINAPVEGRLGRWFVQEGSHVKAGDPIVEILDNDPEIINRLNMEKKAIEMRLKAAEQAAEIATINVNRQKALYEQGISARRTYEQAKFELARYLTDIADAKVSLANLQVRLARQESQNVRATRSGTILRRLTGQESVMVKAGDVLADFVPDTQSRAVELWVNSNDIPLIEVKQHVRLQFEGWPAIQFSGWPSVAVGTFGGEVAIVDAAANSQGQFRVLVVPTKTDPWPETRYLRQGIRVHGWILLGRVQLWFELWRQFNGFPPTRGET